MATNRVILLENVDDRIHFLQIFADTAMGGSPSSQIFQHNMQFPSVNNVCYVDSGNGWAFPKTLNPKHNT